MNTTHHLESGLEREISAGGWYCFPAGVDVSVSSSNAPSSASANRLWSELESSRLTSSPTEAKNDSVEPNKKTEFLSLRRQLLTRQTGWDSWDKLSDL